MSRRNISKKRFPKPDSRHNSYLVSLLIARILKAGKKNLAKDIVYKSLKIINKKTKKNSLLILQKAVKKARPKVEVKSRRVGGSTVLVPMEINKFRALTLALRWIILFSKKRPGRSLSIKLANEIIETANNYGSTIKKKHTTHKIAEANKAFSHFRY